MTYREQMLSFEDIDSLFNNTKYFLLVYRGSSFASSLNVNIKDFICIYVKKNLFSIRNINQLLKSNISSIYVFVALKQSFFRNLKKQFKNKVKKKSY